MELNTTGPAKYICFKLSKVMRKVQKYYENRLVAFGITPVQFYVFNVLWEKDGLKFKELAEKVNMDGATLTGILDRMERSGFVKRQDDPEDRRSLLVYLTAKSKSQGQEMVRLADGFDDDVRQQIPEAEFITFLKVLDDLYDSEL
ncbi:MAG: MarR family transcriptional regulator [Clostridiales bacterium]|jgi:DNA-binding MarR family transcriptional regulator|nr:MarR family transcriptional regulator [Clostridiales bacterium]